MPLTDTAVRNAKPKDTTYSLTDERGLSVQVQPSGGKWWRLRYRFEGKAKMLSLGTYPDVTLGKARERRDDARRLLADGIDPGENRKATKAAGQDAASNSFAVLCHEWLQSRVGQIQPAQIDKSQARLEKDVLPWIGKKPISS